VQKPISLRYPVVELVCAALFAFCLGRDGLTATGFAWCGFSAALLALALIDWDTTFCRTPSLCPCSGPA
jgi:leader peptidase (prepilin peptidase)/N-methyltransferase